MNPPPTAEGRRLKEESLRKKNWKRWGTYLPERQWGTVREDYSADGDAWRYFPHDAARSRAYRWGEDGLLGWTDRECRLCFAVALWNGRDPFLKERLFGLSNPEGNHGEDVKECYYYLDNTPTHSYARALYKYPQAAFPYERLVEENARLGGHDREFELEETGVFDEERYFDCFIEYAKAAPEDTIIRVRIVNRGPNPAELHLLPTLWFRNTWSWGRDPDKPLLHLHPRESHTVLAEHATLGRFRWIVQETGGEWLFTENETNTARLFGSPVTGPVKDAFHDRVVAGRRDAVSPAMLGTKAAWWWQGELAPGEERVFLFRLVSEEEWAGADPSTEAMQAVLEERRAEADAFYAHRYVLPKVQAAVARQAFAGLLWSKQFYHYIVYEWLEGDPGQPPPPPERARIRNVEWRHHLYNRDVISMPDKWEYPWYAAWDLAFHMVAFARIDGDFAKRQLRLFLREWYLHPNGQMPAYEWNFSDVNPPVHAWACWRVYKLAGRRNDTRDRLFLERCFQKLLLNFTWWVNRKDVAGKSLFSGGFLGLDNIGLFDRSQRLPGCAEMEQADGTAWMAFYCGTMLAMALELARENPAYEDIASKFFEHYIQIVDAMNAIGGNGLWHEEDGFYYDHLSLDGKSAPVRVRSLVGLIPLLAVEVIDQRAMAAFPGFRKRALWFVENRPDLASHIACLTRNVEGAEEACAFRMLSIPSRDRLERVLRYLLDENEFLSPHGIRSLSRAYEGEPYSVRVDGEVHSIAYEPGEATGRMFGGNSNWRGPIWMPVNYLLIEALERYHLFYGDTLKVELPTGSGNWVNLGTVARDLERRLASLFLPDEEGRRPIYRETALADRYATHPHWKDLVLFHEYFHADTGRGLGASHQTGWTALVTRCLGR